jgi:hypothetical protein
VAEAAQQAEEKIRGLHCPTPMLLSLAGPAALQQQHWMNAYHFYAETHLVKEYLLLLLLQLGLPSC